MGTARARALLAGLFGSWTRAALTLAMLGLFALVLPPFLHWALLDATWDGLSRKACSPDGACWAFIRARLPLFFYGHFPPAERWRVDLALALLLAVAVPTLFARHRQGVWMLLLLLGVPVLGLVLLLGGVFGLAPVGVGDWGGLMLNVALSFAVLVFALPLGVLLAFGRRSTLPILRWGSTGFIEIWRGVPLLGVLFMGLVMLPMFLPDGMNVGTLVRAIVVLSLFESAYLAEVVRGGLQSVPQGQAEAAMALGMHHAKAQLLVVLPQALRVSIPGIINIVVDLFKDTTLVSIVGLAELMGVVNQSLKDQAWLGLAREGYVFAALVFFIACLALSLTGQVLERRFGAARRR